MRDACCKDPLYCIYALWCGCCAAYQQRTRQMGAAWPREYTCCNDGSCISGSCGEESNPELCLCCEVFCCFPSAMATTRFMIQDEQRVMNTQCDNCLIGCMIVTQQIALCVRCVAMITQNPEIEQLADLVDCCADMVYCSVCACMLTQHHVQLKHRDHALAQGRPRQQQIVMAAPVAPMMAHGQPEPRYSTQRTYVYTVPPPQQGKPTGIARSPTQNSRTAPPQPSRSPSKKGGKSSETYYADI